MPCIVIVASVALGVAHLAAYYAGRRVPAGLLKALPVLLLAWTVWRAGDGRIASGLVASGLLLSAVGDVSLVFPAGFLAGLSAFLVAHCCYIAALATPAAWSGGGITIGGAVGVVAGIVLAYLWPHVARVRVPVVVYVAALSSMVWCAGARAVAPTAGTAELAAAVGAVAFLVSDGVLAVNRFARPFAGAHGVVMVTYYTAQLLIARGAFA